MERTFRVMEALFVFGRWTLMMDPELSGELQAGDSIDLLGESGQPIGRATIESFARSRNPAIQPVAVEPEVDPDDFKNVKAIRLSNR